MRLFTVPKGRPNLSAISRYLNPDTCIEKGTLYSLGNAYKLTADREEANDLLQETSLKALDNEEKYVPDTNFKGWMYTIML